MGKVVVSPYTEDEELNTNLGTLLSTQAFKIFKVPLTFTLLNPTGSSIDGCTLAFAAK